MNLNLTWLLRRSSSLNALTVGKGGGGLAGSVSGGVLVGSMLDLGAGS